MKNLDFRNYTNNSSDHFNAVSFRNDVLLRQRYESLFTEGTFYAVCLSSFKDEENTGESKELGSSSNVSLELEITVKPISQQEFNNALQGNFNVVVEGAPVIGDSLPPLVGLTDPNDIMRKLDLYHSAQYLKAKSRLSDKAGNLSLSFGEIVECYYEFGSIIEGTAQGLRFRKLEQSSIHEGYTQLLSVAPLISSLNSFKAGAFSFLGDIQNSSLGAKTSPSQASFIANLGAALKQKGLPFVVTDRSRTVEEQMQRIMNKYENNGPQEVISTYGKNRGAKMVSAIKSGDQATFRQLASKSSKHLKGNAIDIRSWHYTNEQMTVVLQEIRKLGGNPLVENIEGCWTNSGRNVTTTQRVAGAKAGGRGKNTPCHNEHIHIDIPENYSG
jgi:hypothetical protein